MIVFTDKIIPKVMVAMGRLDASHTVTDVLVRNWDQNRTGKVKVTLF
jgi:hypothetical protein